MNQIKPLTIKNEISERSKLELFKLLGPISSFKRLKSSESKIVNEFIYSEEEQGFILQTYILKEVWIKGSILEVYKDSKSVLHWRYKIRAERDKEIVTFDKVNTRKRTGNWVANK